MALDALPPARRLRHRPRGAAGGVADQAPRGKQSLMLENQPTLKLRPHRAFLHDSLNSYIIYSLRCRRSGECSKLRHTMSRDGQRALSAVGTNKLACESGRRGRGVEYYGVSV
jgi:hypothetical protein